MKVAVIGAGISGVTTAYSLARRGCEVTVYDKHDYAGMQTSFANGGQFSVSNSEVWTTWGNVLKGAKWLLKKDAPLLIRPAPSWSKLKWVSEFLWNTATGRYEKDTRETIGLALRARGLYLDIAEREGLEFNLVRKGILHFYRDAHYFEAAKYAVDRLYKGVERHVVSPDEIARMEPSLNIEGVIGGVYTPDDMSGDTHKLCTGLRSRLADHYGVEFCLGRKLTMQELRVVQNINDAVVICTGVDSAHISKAIGDPLNIYPVKGYSITIPTYGKTHASYLDDQAKIVCSHLGDRIRVAGTAELDGCDYDIRMDRIAPLTKWAKLNLNISTEHAVPWAGLRPMTPSLLPIVRKAKADRFWFNTGHGHLGLTLAAATAEIIAGEITAR
jgi:D-amino-acid dehydrogenase